MATYKEIKGVTVQALDADPVVNAGSWASGPSLNTARYQASGAGATQNAAWIVGGAIPPASPNLTAVHEQYNGTSWTEAADLGTAKYGAGSFGTTTAALIAGGYDGAYEDDVETWNGSSWTEVSDLNSVRGYSGGSGTTTAGIIYGGLNPGGGGVQAVAETWNGSSWTEVGDLNTARSAGAKPSNGTQTAAIFSSGNNGTTVETWDGSSWTEVSDVNTQRSAAFGMGTSTAQLICGGYAPPAYITNTENWNGSAWTEVNDLSTGRGQDVPNGAGTATSAIAAGGVNHPGSPAGSNLTTNTEEWDFPPPTASTLTEGDIFLSGVTTLKGFGKIGGAPATSWSSGGNLNTGRGGLANGSTGSSSSASLAFGGNPY